MKIFLSTARIDDVAWGVTHGMLDGVLTTPRLLADEGGSDARAHLVELCRLVHGPIFAAIQMIDAAAARRAISAPSASITPRYDGFSR